MVPNCPSRTPLFAKKLFRANFKCISYRELIIVRRTSTLKLHNANGGHTFTRKPYHLFIIMKKKHAERCR